MAGLTRREVLGIGALSLVRVPPERSVVRPEYERTLSRALVTLPDASGDTDPASLSRYLEAAFRDLRTALPSYTVLEVAARTPRTELPGARLHRVEDPSIEIELFAQDVGESVVVGGEERFLVARRMPDSMGPPSRMSANRKRVAEIVFGEGAVIEASFVFEGGNLAFDGDRVLIGTNDVSRTIACAEGPRSRRQVLEDVGAAFGGVEAVEMGNEPPSPLLQHLDQAFVLLHDRVAVACRLGGGGRENEARQLRRHADQLRELGYRLLFVDHETADVSGYRSSVNVVPFYDREAARKRVLLPVFPGELKEGTTALDRSALTGKAARAFDLYRDLGYEPSPLRDVTHALGGNTHCILNVLA